MGIPLKDSDAIEKIARAGRIVAEALASMANAVAVGVKTAQLNRIAEDLIIKRGGKPSFKGYKGYPFATCISVNEQVVHGFPGSRTLQSGDIVGMDVGVYLDGYHADAATTVPVGFVSPLVQSLLLKTKLALSKAIFLVSPGVQLGDLSVLIQQEAENSGFSVVRDLFGHGIGKELHEPPMIPNFGKPRTGVTLKKGMVLAIEPMLVIGNFPIKVLNDGWTVVTQDGKWASHEEHTIVVTDNGCKILTMLER